MDEKIYKQVEEAIRRELNLGLGLGPPLNRPKYCYPIAIEGDNITVRDSDCGFAKDPWTLTVEQWAENVELNGLWRRVGFWDFVLADDPDADLIRSAHSSPEWAGREIVRLRAELEKAKTRIVELEEENASMESALICEYD